VLQETSIVCFARAASQPLSDSRHRMTTRLGTKQTEGATWQLQCRVVQVIVCNLARLVKLKSVRRRVGQGGSAGSDVR
jgi:hypothetical protein